MSHQKEFIMYLCAAVPSMETLTMCFVYETEKREIEEKDFVKEYLSKLKGRRRDIVEGLAKSKGIPLNEYVQERAEKMKDAALKAQREQYVGILFAEESEEDNARQAAIDKANRLADSMKEGQEQASNVMALLNKVPDGAPEELKEVFNKDE